MREMIQVCGRMLLGVCRYFFRIWALGWRVIFKVLIGYLAVSLFLTPVQWMADALWRVGELWPLSWPQREHPIVAVIFGLFVFYVAGS